jgi:hypothetical protein
MAMTTEGRNLVYEVLADDRLIVSCQNTELPSDAEWDNRLRAATNLRHKVREFRVLVVTAGGHPTKAQIDRLRAENRDYNPPTAIISSSFAYRFMASALTFVNPTIRCYSTENSERAFEHLALTQVERGRANAALERLSKRLTTKLSAD